jgi:hypothetical protein
MLNLLISDLIFLLMTLVIFDDKYVTVICDFYELLYCFLSEHNC